MNKTKAARHSGNCDTRQKPSTDGDWNIVPREYDRATLIWGIAFAVSIGLMMLHWAVIA